MQLIETLLAMGRKSSIESAVESVCEQNGISRARNSSEWKFMFPVTKDANILELGAGVGEDSIKLSAECPELTSVVPSSSNAELLKMRLRERGVANIQISVLDNLTYMPWKNAAFGGIAFEDAAAAGFHLSSQTFPEFAKECCRLLQPGGSVCIGISNHLHRSGMLHKLKSKLQTKCHTESLNRIIKREGGNPEITLKLGSVISAMQAAGFDTPQLFAPMPDEKQTKAVVPLDAPETLIYYFNHLVRSDTLIIRTATMLMKVLIRLGMIRLALPYYIAVFRLQNDTLSSQSQTK